MYLNFKLSNGKVVEGNVSKTAVTIGRSNKADFVVSDEAFSRVHCLIEVQDGNFYITDLGSANGVFIDGNRIPPDQKTPFTTFMQLAAGPVEFTVQDDADSLTLEDAPTRTQISTSAMANNETRVMNSPGRAASAPPRRERTTTASKPSMDPKIFGAVILLTLGGLYYFFGREEETTLPEPMTTTESATTPVSQARSQIIKSSITPEFASQERYLNLETKKNCTGFAEICQEFKLEENENEGVVIDEKEAFVYLQPVTFFELPHLSFLNKLPDGPEMLSHYLVLKSTLMSKVYTRELDQIHLLMLGPDKKIKKVFRYHVRQFNEGNEDRFRYLELLNAAFMNQNLDEITPILQKDIPSLEFK